MEQRVRRPKVLRGEIIPTADKSISHRSLILNSVASGEAHISNFLPAADCLSSLACLEAIGVVIRRNGGNVTVRGAGRNGFTPPNHILDAGNSGTTIRLLSGLLAAQPFTSEITGDESLRSRPMARVIKPLSLMGADITGQDNNTKAPLVIRGRKLHGIRYRMPVASAQVKSAILLAALFAEGDTTVEEPVLSRDHTERMLRAMGVGIKSKGTTITISPSKAPPSPLDIRVPGDISSAAFWLVAGAIHPDARIRIRDVGMNPTRTGIVDVLLAMGARLKVANEHIEGSEPVADILIESSSLKGTTIEGDIIPRVIDEIPVIAVAAALADGTTVIRDASELRVKESDRIKTTVNELSKLGAKIEELPDGMIVHGASRLRGNLCDSHSDHRLAMALAVAGLAAEGETTISGAEAVDISYPRFWEDLRKLATPHG